MDEIYAHFNHRPIKIANWSRLLMLASDTMDLPTPDVLYNRAIPTLVHLKNELLQLGWQQVPKEQLPPGIRFMVESPAAAPTPSASSSNADARDSFFNSSTSSFETMQDATSSSSTNLERVIFALPSELSAFLEYRLDIQEIFHNPRLFKPVLNQFGHPVLIPSDELDPLSAPALIDIFYLLQLIVPGMFLLVHDSLSFAQKPFSLNFPPTRRSNQGSHLSREQNMDSTASRDSTKLSFRRTRRALPPAEWIESRLELLEGIFGRQLLHDLLNCARDVELTLWTTFHGPDGDELDAGSDAGFDSPKPLDLSWPPDSPVEDMTEGINIPFKVPAITPGVEARNRIVHHTRLARSL